MEDKISRDEFILLLKFFSNITHDTFKKTLFNDMFEESYVDEKFYQFRRDPMRAFLEVDSCCQQKLIDVALANYRVPKT